jgi:aminoglycoside phosphotransferase (APT) family kinase protein
MAERRLSLVHGDFSPKNILVAEQGQPGFWVIDFEVAHRGDPVFDLAFMCTHLLLKSLALPGSRIALDSCVGEFLSAYEQTTAAAIDFGYLARHIGALMLARVRGKSPVEYLDDRARAITMRIGESLLQAPAGDLTELLQRRDENLQ